MSGPVIATQFVSAHSRAKWLNILFIVVVVLYALAAVQAVSTLVLIEEVKADSSTAEALRAWLVRQTVIVWASWTLVVGVPVLFLLWIHRAYNNLSALQVDKLEYSASWAVWGFFVPLLNLIRPFHVVRELWHGSDPKCVGQQWTHDSSVPSVIRWWWGSFWLAGFLTRMQNMWSNKADAAQDIESTVTHFTTAGWFQLAASLTIICAAILALHVVRRIDEAQASRSKAVLPGLALASEPYYGMTKTQSYTIE